MIKLRIYTKFVKFYNYNKLLSGKYKKSKVVYINQYGTPENLNSIPEKILNVSDAYTHMKEGCNVNMDLNVEKYKTHKVIQTLHIYENGKEIEYE